MPASVTASNLRRTFRAVLHDSLATGRGAMVATGLGPQTMSAISAVAQAHPDASAEAIIAAYEAFAREHAMVGSQQKHASHSA